MWIGQLIHVKDLVLDQCIAAIVTEVTETDFACTIFSPHGDRGDTARRLRIDLDNKIAYHDDILALHNI